MLRRVDFLAHTFFEAEHWEDRNNFHTKHFAPHYAKPCYQPFLFLSCLSGVRWLGGSFANFGFSVALCDLQVCIFFVRWSFPFKVKNPINFNYSSSTFSVKSHKTIFDFIAPLICNHKSISFCNVN